MLPRTLFPLALLLPAVALAAPVPKETEAEKIKRLFGTPADPEKDCKFTLDGEKLVLRTPEASHVFGFGNGIGNAPRVTRTVEGDFVATVRIRMAPPQPPQPYGPRMLFQAGLYVADSDTSFAFNTRAVEDQNGTIRRTGRHGAWVSGNQQFSGSSGGGAFDPETTFLRVTRTGDTTQFGASADGKGWHVFAGPKVQYGDKVTLGLFAANPGGLPFAAEFDQFTVTAPPAPKK
jgi:regulation of enolase protein 1 (concanavalin A-like superfamily)